MYKSLDKPALIHGVIFKLEARDVGPLCIACKNVSNGIT